TEPPHISPHSLHDALPIFNMLWRTLPKREEEKTVAEARRYPSEPQENLLYFMEKNAPLLESWQREILRIVRKVSQYFYPQKQTRSEEHTSELQSRFDLVCR